MTPGHGEATGMATSRVAWIVSASLAAGAACGWTVAAGRPARLMASGGDRHGASAVQTGMITETKDRQGKTLATQDALYVLNYSNGLLLAAVPSYQHHTGTVPDLPDAPKVVT